MPLLELAACVCEDRESKTQGEAHEEHDPKEHIVHCQCASERTTCNIVWKSSACGKITLVWGCS